MYSSSESFAPMSRLLWKEYRAHRALWLAMFLFGLGPQLVIRVAVGDLQDRIGATWAVAATVPMLFLIGAIAILFAGEREERTSDWLVHLSVSPVWLMLAKWGFVLLSALALMLSLSVAAVLLVWALPTLTTSSRGSSPVALTFWCFAAFVLWGSFGSLLSRRVVTAIPAMFFWWVMTMVLPVMWLPQVFGITYAHPRHERYQEVFAVLSFMAIGAADIWLAWRWCQGKYLDARVFDEFNSLLAASLDQLGWRTGVKSRARSQIEFDNSWRREWQRLIWQERHRESYHRSLLYVGCVVGPLLAMLGSWNGSDMMSGVLPLLVLFPMVMALLGFRYDGEGQPLRFLANRGVSPHVLWLAKHVVWLPRAVWIPLTVWLVAFALEKLGPAQAAHPGSLRSTSEFVWAHFGVILWFVLLSYGCGHLAAMVMRRVVLAIVVGVGLSVVASLWLSVMVTLQVPLWWSVGGLVAWIYGLSWWYSPQWLMEDRARPRLVQCLAALAIPPVLLVTAIGTWRISEISNFTPDLNITADIARQSQPVSSRDLQLLDRLSMAASGFSSVREFELSGMQQKPPSPEREQWAREQFWKSNESSLREIMEITKQERLASPSRSLELSRSEARTLSQTLLPQQQKVLEAGRLRTEEGRLAEALDYYCASLRLATFWATNSGVATRGEAERQQLFTFQYLILWANHPDQTGESLRAAVRRIQQEVALFPPIRETLVAEYLRDRVQIEDQVKRGLTREPGEAGWLAAVAESSRYMPWEKTRAEVLLEKELNATDQATVRLGLLLKQSGVDAMRLLERYHWDAADEERARRTTPLIPTRWQGLGRSILSAMVEREVAVRESVVALSLMAWKRDHDKWPETLGELLSPDERALSAVTIIDPWNGDLFHYNGRLLNQPGETPASAVLLSTVGPSVSRDVYVDDPRDGHGTTANGLSIGTKHWTGTKASYDDRTKVLVANGKMSLQLPNTVRFRQ